VPIRILPGAGHGSCFVDPRLRELALAFLAAQPRPEPASGDRLALAAAV
jgi:hypothetical protein